LWQDRCSIDEQRPHDRRSLVSGAAAALAMPAIGQAEADRVLRFIPQADLAVVDPVWTSVAVTRNHGYMV